VRAGPFREDMLARINLWTFALPGLRDRREYIEPNLKFELLQQAERTGTRVTFNKEARARFLAFAAAPTAAWNGNFRDLGAAVARMSTFGQGGRIHVALVQEEVARLEASWRGAEPDTTGAAGLAALLSASACTSLDLFDRLQLEAVLSVCRRAKSLSEAGRTLFNASRQERKSVNDADRLRKYLALLGLDWRQVGPAA